MKMQPECFGCFFQQANRLLRYLKIPKERRFAILKKIGDYLFHIDKYTRTPAFYASAMYKILYESTGVKDPYKYVKRKYNKMILEMYPKLLKLIKKSEHPIYTALKLSAIGNIIDFGVETSLDIQKEIKNINSIKFMKDDFKIFKKMLTSAKKIFLIADNAGEIIFDKLLLETISSTREYEIVIGVRGKPVINDVTIDDLKGIKFNKNIKIVSNGNDNVGTILSKCSKEFLNEFKSADIIISKGQANFESLNDLRDEPIFFLFRAKCAPVAKFLQVKQDSLLFYYNKK